MHPSTTKPHNFRNVMLLIIIVLLLGLTGMSLRQMMVTQRYLDGLTVQLNQAYGVGTPQEKALREIMAKVRKHVAIPNDSQVTVATVTNAEELKKENPFYTSARNGDTIVITPLRAIIYRAAEDRIVDMTNITTGGTSSAQGSKKVK